MPLALADFIQALPKTETHLHVEGALPYELLTAWDAARYPADPPFRRRDYRYATFPEFEGILLDNALPWFTTAERYYEATRVMFAQHLAQNDGHATGRRAPPISGQSIGHGGAEKVVGRPLRPMRGKQRLDEDAAGGQGIEDDGVGR